MPMSPAEVLQKPSLEEVEKLFRNHAMREYRIDIESDSTVRGDVQKNQEQMSLFLTGTAQYLSAVGPMVQQGVMPADLALEVYAAFSRTFRLGKQAEDALDRLADQSRKQAGQPKPPSEAQQKMMLEQQKMQHDKEMSTVEIQVKQAELVLKEREIQMKMALDEQKAKHEAMLKEMELQQEMRLAEMKAEHDAQIAQQEAAIKQQALQREADIKAQVAAESAALKVNEARVMGEQKIKQGQEQHLSEMERRRAMHALEQQIAKADGEARTRLKMDLEAKSHAKREAETAKERAKPRKLKVKVVRGADGRMAGAEIED